MRTPKIHKTREVYPSADKYRWNQTLRLFPEGQGAFTYIGGGGGAGGYSSGGGGGGGMTTNTFVYTYSGNTESYSTTEGGDGASGTFWPAYTFKTDTNTGTYSSSYEDYYLEKNYSGWAKINAE